MKKIYLSLLVFFISASVFAGGWLQDFSSEVTSIDEGDVETPVNDSEWYFTATTTTNMLGWKTVQTAWKNSTSWNRGTDFKPAGKFVYLDGASGWLNNVAEFSLVSPAFTPTANASDLYYRIQEIKVSDSPGAGAEELYVEVATKVEGVWTWTASTDNVLEELDGYNTATFPATVLQKSLSSYADQEIKIRFRGKVDAGNFVAVISNVALIDNTVTDLGVSTAQNITSQIPLKHANQALNASVQNLGSAVAADAATVAVSIAETNTSVATANVPALNPLETATLSFAASSFAPQSFGEYRIQYTLSGDGNADNNTATSNAFTIAPNTFAVDTGFVQGTAGSTSLDLGNKFTLAVADKVESISVGWGKLSSDPSSLEFQLVIYALGADGVLNTTPVYVSPAPLTRPDNATTPPNNRLATFETYSVDKNLEAGAYIFAVRSTANIGIGTNYDNNNVYYKIDKTEGELTSTAGQYLLIRVNTASDITLSPAIGSKTAGLSEPIVIAGSAITGLAASPAITIKKADDTEVANVSASYAEGKMTIAHATFEFNTTYTITVPANTITGYASALSWSFTTAGPLAVKTFSPSNNGTNAALNAILSVGFDRNIPAGSTLEGITIETVVEDGETPVAVSNVSATTSGSVLNITHDPFERSTKYKATVPASAISELTADTSWVFTTVPPVALAASPFYPVDNATDVAVSEIRVIFNQAVDPASTLADITINGNAVTASIGEGNNNSRVILNTTDFTFAENTLYTVVIPAGAIAGYSEAITWSFTTFLTLAPVTFTPAKGFQTVPVDTEISIEFNKEFNIMGYNPPEVLILTSGGTLLEGVTYEKDADNPKKLVISHTDPLLPDTVYTVIVPVDAAASYAGVDDWTFKTEPTTLKISGFTPEDGEENVAVRNTVEVTFNKTIVAGTTDNIRINDVAPTSVTLQSSEGYTQNILRLNHLAFAQGTEYTVTIPAGSVVGFDRDTTWSFTTVPVLTYTTSPVNNATDVALDAPLKIEFDRAPLRPLTGFAEITVTGDNGEEITITDTEWNTLTGSDTLTIGHAPFDPEVTYTVNVVATSIINAADWSGESSITWSFTTTDDTGVQEIKVASGVYPTLTKGDITVISEPGSLIKITDIAGVVRATYRSIGTQLPIHLNGADGLYLVVIENSKSTLTYKVVLQK
jgi:hypothetical protein